MDPQLITQAHQQSSYCRVFSNTTRILILWVMNDDEMSVGAIADAVGASLQNVSQHLSIMKECGVVASRRDRQTIYYRINLSAMKTHCSDLFQKITSNLEFVSH